MDIDSFINNLKVLADFKADESVTNKALISFEQTISANLFSCLRNNTIQNIFMNIFQILFALSLHETTSIRLESSRAMSIFLSRILPYYNELLQKSFSKAIEDLKIRTPLVPASFAFMSKHVSQPLLLQYINITPIVEQFQVNDPCYSFIIDNMGQLGIGFLQYLLKKLIDQLKVNPNRHLFRAIGSVIKHNPSLFLPQILKLDFLTLFAYVFLNIEFDHSKFDLSHIVELIFTTLQSNTASPLERDCAYQILSTMQPKVSISAENPDLIDVTFYDKKVTLDPQKNSDRPPFFLLPLPLKFLYPQKNESVLSLSPKFKTIAKSANEENITEILSIFRNQLDAPYDETVSAAIIGLASQPKLLNSPQLLNMFIYKKSVSWFHSIDILRVIKSFQIVNVHTLNLLYEFIVSGNIRLSDEAIDTVKYLTNEENSEKIENFFSQKIDMFDENVLERILTTLVAISDKSSVPSYLNFLIKMLLEEIEVHKDNVKILSLIFDFLSHKDISFLNDRLLNPACKIAIAICEAYLSAICRDIAQAESNYNDTVNTNNSGKNQKIQSKDDQISIDFKHYLNFANKDILSRNFDIINEEMDYKHFFPNFAASANFLFKLSIYIIGVNKAIDISSRVFTFFPKLCSSFFERNWGNIDESYKLNILQVLFMKLQFVSDFETVAIWCRIAIKTPSIFKNTQVSKTVQSLNFTCATLLTPDLHDMKSAAAFSAYLFNSIGEQHKKSMSIFIANLKDYQKSALLDELNILMENKLPQFFTDIFSQNEKSKADTNLIDLDSPSDENKEADVTLKINETGFVADVNRAILSGNSYEVIRLLKTGLKDEVSFNLFDFCYPSLMIREISKWVSTSCTYSSVKKMLFSPPQSKQNDLQPIKPASELNISQPNGQTVEAQSSSITTTSVQGFPNHFSLFDFLSLARTDWKYLVISFMKGDPNNSVQLLKEISDSVKVKYNTILNVSSIASFVYFDSSELFKLAARVAMGAEKLKKMRASYLFFANAISIINRTNKNGQFKPQLIWTYSVSVPDSQLYYDFDFLLEQPKKQTNVERFLIPADFPLNYVNRMNSFFDLLPRREVSLALYQITQNLQRVDSLFLFFCRKLLFAGSKYMSEAGNLCSILLPRYDDLISVNKTLTIDFDSIVQNMLNFNGTADNESENSNAANANNNSGGNKGLFGNKNKNKESEPAKKNLEIYWSDDIISDASTSPSMFLNACRIINSVKKFKNTLHTILSSYRFWHRIPYLNKMIIKTITRDLWHERFRYMKKFFDKIDQTMPEFDTVLKFAAFVLSSPELQKKNQDDEMCGKSFSIFSRTIEMPTSRKLLNTALCCLIARLNFVCVADNDKSQTMVMDALIEWLNGLDKKDGPLTLFFAFDFAKILEMKMEAQSFFALIACQYIRCAPRFFTVFPAVAKYYLKYKKCGWANEIIKSLAPSLKSQCHKKALDLLIENNLEISLKLAMFDSDCDESNKLMNMPNDKDGDLIDLS